MGRQTLKDADTQKQVLGKPILINQVCLIKKVLQPLLSEHSGACHCPYLRNVRTQELYTVSD